jgi:hypothetical protein
MEPDNRNLSLEVTQILQGTEHKKTAGRFKSAGSDNILKR